MRCWRWGMKHSLRISEHMMKKYSLEPKRLWGFLRPPPNFLPTSLHFSKCLNCSSHNSKKNLSLLYLPSPTNFYSLILTLNSNIAPLTSSSSSSPSPLHLYHSITHPCALYNPPSTFKHFMPPNRTRYIPFVYFYLNL